MNQNADQEYRQRNGKTGPHAVADVIADVTSVIRTAKIKGEQFNGGPEEKGVCQFRTTLGYFVINQWLVVAVILLPFDDSLGRDALDAEMDARHVIRTVDEEKQRKGDQVHTDQDRNGIQQPAHDIGDHRSLLRIPAPATVRCLPPRRGLVLPARRRTSLSRLR